MFSFSTSWLSYKMKSLALDIHINLSTSFVFFTPTMLIGTVALYLFIPLSFG